VRKGAELAVQVPGYEGGYEGVGFAAGSGVGLFGDWPVAGEERG
jgi:hypothetical protein